MGLLEILLNALAPELKGRLHGIGGQVLDRGVAELGGVGSGNATKKLGRQISITSRIIGALAGLGGEGSALSEVRAVRAATSMQCSQNRDADDAGISSRQPDATP